MRSLHLTLLGACSGRKGLCLHGVHSEQMLPITFEQDDKIPVAHEHQGYSFMPVTECFYVLNYAYYANCMQEQNDDIEAAYLILTSYGRSSLDPFTSQVILQSLSQLVYELVERMSLIVGSTLRMSLAADRECPALEVQYLLKCLTQVFSQKATACMVRCSFQSHAILFFMRCMLCMLEGYQADMVPTRGVVT